MLLVKLQDALAAAFEAANQYSDTFESYRKFYRENGLCDLEAVRQQEHGNSVFEMFARVSEGELILFATSLFDQTATLRLQNNGGWASFQVWHFSVKRLHGTTSSTRWLRG